MPWLQISIATTKKFTDNVESCLFNLGAQTVTLSDAADQAILEPAPNETPLWNEIIVTGLFDFNQSVKSLSENIKNSLTDINYVLKTETLEDRNWTQAWMADFHAMSFGQRLWICPLHISPPEPQAINLRLDPGLAFGTGTHPTTSLCLRWLDKHIIHQQNFLDYGCGSGILAIAACLLGCNFADAVDIDPQAIIATNENAKINGVAKQINSVLADDYLQQKNKQYDVVVANILSGPLCELAPTLATYTKKGGQIILSGILKEQANATLKIYQQYFKMSPPVFLDDWTLLVGENL